MSTEEQQITQKDLLKLLFDQAQHNATREELQGTEQNLRQDMTELRQGQESARKDSEQRFEQVNQRFDELRKDFQSEMRLMREESTKRFRWVITTVIAVGAVIVPLASHYIQLIK